MKEPSRRRVRWTKAFRIIPSRYPPIQLFERIGDPSEWESLAEVESLTNDRIRQELGYISVVPIEERVSGPGASWLMASFTHIGRESRFSDGSYGVYYCSRRRETAVAETMFHMGRFYVATSEPPLDVDMRVLVGSIDAAFHDIRTNGRRWKDILDPDSYRHSQAFGCALRDGGSNGVVYRSVRHVGGQCLGAFRPKAVNPPEQAAHLTYHWNGERMDRYFDHGSGVWITV